jgi:hypothetical protein
VIEHLEHTNPMMHDNKEAGFLSWILIFAHPLYSDGLSAQVKPDFFCLLPGSPSIFDYHNESFCCLCRYDDGLSAWCMRKEHYWKPIADRKGFGRG